MSLLDAISGPEDLKRLAPDQLPALAAEVRARLIDQCSVTGGHIGASLGVVELAIALLYEFESPIDKIVWDVGHQAYGHKILFVTFPRPIEGVPRADASPATTASIARAAAARRRA